MCLGVSDECLGRRFAEIYSYLGQFLSFFNSFDLHL